MPLSSMMWPQVPDICGKGLESKALGFNLMIVHVRKNHQGAPISHVSRNLEVNRVYSAVLSLGVERKKLEIMQVPKSMDC